METPKNKAGETTEQIMSRIGTKVSSLTVDQYNKIYSSVYEVLSNGSDVSQKG